MNFFSLLACLVFSFNVYTQTGPEMILLKADSLFDAKQYKASIGLYENAAKEFELMGELDGLFKSVYGIGNSLLKEKEYENLIRELESYLSKYKAFQHSLDKLLYSKIMLLLAISYRRIENFHASLNYYEIAIIELERISSKNASLIYAYKNAAQIYERRLDYKKAIMYLERAIEIGGNTNYSPSIYAFLANDYLELGNTNISEMYYLKGMACVKDSEDSVLLKLAFADILRSKGKIRDSDKVMENYVIENKEYESSNTQIWLGYKDLAASYLAKGDEKMAMKLLYKAFKAVKIRYPNKNREAAKISVEIGRHYFNISKLDSSLFYYQQALIQVFPKFNSTNIADNPDIKDVYTESWIMTAAARKAEALHLRYQQKGDIADLRNAAYCFDLSLAGVKQLHKSYGSDGAKLYMGDYSHNYFEEAIEVNNLLYTKTGEQSYLQKIFSLMEQSKASVLSDAIQQNKALLLTGIPDSLLELEKDLRISIADYTTQMQNTEVEGQGSEEEVLAKIKSQLSEYQLKHERLLEQMKAAYPNFRAYIEEYPEPSFEEVQGKLVGDKTVFVEFFAGDKAFYCLTIGRNRATIMKIERNPELECLLQEYFAFFKNADAILADPDRYLATSHELFKTLFPKLLQNGKTGLQQIVLVPDGLLGFLPFDALVTYKAGPFSGFGTVDFLVKKFGLRYAYSANVLLQQNEGQERKGKLLRVMPRFTGGERGLAPLKFSDEETTDGISWQSLDGGQATKAQFKATAETARLLHLSTHAESNAGAGEPFIELADGQLLLPELYAMNLSAADLVVLSACETGLGEVAKGEGVMSLARGFAYAGAGSLVASLWKVNERSTATLFAHFYQYLAEGKTKSEALRLAKLSLLENAATDARQSPYYWAGFVFMGSDGGMDLTNKWRNWLLALGGAGLAMGALVVFFRKKRRKLTA